MATISDYEPAYLSNVVSVLAECFPEIPSLDLFHSMIARKQEYQPGLFLVAKDGNNIIGTVVGGFDGVNGWIYMVAVHPDARRQGIASNLVQAIEQRLKAVGATRVSLQVLIAQQHLVQFYEKFGYIVEPRVSMAKNLESS